MIKTCDCTSHNGPVNREPLHIHDYLSEFKTETEKALARKNLGVLDALNALKKAIDDEIAKIKTIEDSEALKLTLISYIDTSIDNKFATEEFKQELITYVSKAVEELEVQLAGVPIYDLDYLDKYKDNLPDKYISIPNYDGVESKTGITYTATGEGTYIDILFSTIRALLSEVAKLKNTFYYGIQSLTETNTTSSSIIEDSEEEELEPLWALDPEDLEELTDLSVKIEQDCLLIPTNQWSYISNTNYINVLDSVSTPILNGYDTDETTPKVIFYGIIDPTSSNWQFHINFSNTIIKVEELVAKLKLSIMFIVSRRITDSSTYNKNFYWISVQNSNGDTILLKYFDKDLSLTDLEQDVDSIEVFNTISMSYVHLYRLDFYIKSQSFTNTSNIVSEKTEIKDFIFRPSHLTIRGVSTKSVLDSIVNNLMELELVYCYGTKGLYIKHNNKLEQLFTSNTSNTSNTTWTFGNTFPIILN